MQYIGMFEIEHGSITFVDPMTVGISADFYNMTLVNTTTRRINEIPNGNWYAYHIYDKNTDFLNFL